MIISDDVPKAPKPIGCPPKGEMQRILGPTLIFRGRDGRFYSTSTVDFETNISPVWKRLKKKSKLRKFLSWLSANVDRDPDATLIWLALVVALFSLVMCIAQWP